ncbi:peptidyl-dipeptidase Dcp [Faunimonas pinastri]|uniref:Peptidyl-dipeptidase Dcp n=1 Tax=Faunimonas pinastri TaxID=1855383 RepID=A0A1H9KYA5_9HYPH|nr:M3 family metallopeptidase [Faunimonas pinastri]SER04058.1 peptidyl-dipeptidase Dcp [Faunimonas pinastri]
MSNPLLQTWSTPFDIPPFDQILPEHFRPAFDNGMQEQRAEVLAIAASAEPPTFANTVEALERSGRTLHRVSRVFFNLTGSNTSDELEAIELEVAPVLTRHGNEIYLNQDLFARVRQLAEAEAGLGLNPEQSRLLQRFHRIFVRSGAALDEASRQRMTEITERLSVLGTKFGQNVLADEKSYALVLQGEADLQGLPASLVAAAAQAATDRDLPGKHVITLSRSSIVPFLQFSSRRDLRETAFKAWIARGENAGATDNRALIAEMVALRAERAKLLGFPTFAHFRLDDSMAKTPEAAMNLLNSVWQPAQARALREAEALQALIGAEGGNFELEPWDWRYYAEQRRKAEFDLDDAEIKPYLQLDRMIEAAFDTARRLFGVSFAERRDLPVYHPDVRVWDVTGRDGRHVGLFLGDYFARSSKHSGAWMSAFRGQQKLEGEIRPIIVNVMNFSKASGGEPTLLSFDDGRTLFHEFGHALHGLLSDVTYPTLAGTSVSRDFVEFPSQLYEHWLEQPEVLRQFALHHRTGEPMPEALLQKLMAARTFNQGFSTVEYVSSAMVDLEFHLLADANGVDATEFERETLKRMGMPRAITMRHRPTHFTHIFSGGYSAAYYSYLWSEVLDADGFNAFEEAGNIFDPETAKRLYSFVYSAGDLRDPEDAYEAFRGRQALPDALLRQRGLVEITAAGAA